MSVQRQRSTSVFAIDTKRKKSESLSSTKFYLWIKNSKIPIYIGVFLTLVTIVLQCVAFWTPHWKEVSSKSHSLYVDGIDALIRNDVLKYYNSVHRFTHHSYGLFQRCEYFPTNLTKQLGTTHPIDFNKKKKICTKNFIPSYTDEQFNQCHSLQYYRFCSKENRKFFNINSDYLYATFDIHYVSQKINDLSSSCNCQYPTYVTVCYVLEIFALIFLSLTAILFAIFPFMKTLQGRLTVKCFGVLSSIFAVIIIFINLIVALNHFDYESIEYLKAIEKHYNINQIYKLSLDAKVAIDRFLSSIRIQTGYSTIIAWIAFVLSIIDGILIMSTCKVRSTRDETTDNEDSMNNRFSGIDSDSTIHTSNSKNQEFQPTTNLSTEQECFRLLPPTITITDVDKQTCTPHRLRFADGT
ncbi:hypothetical protein I4U23_028055 [Adineta vaga]|nr:hypothetical protein I4U23_028055 [Adineta vaga]